MILLFSIILAFLTFIIAIPIIVFAVECAAASRDHNRSWPRFQDAKRPKIAVLIPAHNEALEIEATLKGVFSQTEPEDLVVVIADNCEDKTAEIAAQAGAIVIERTNTKQRGKGYALDYGCQFLEKDPPQVVIMLDADCSIESKMIERVAYQAQETKSPIQALYLMEPPAQETPEDLISAFAFLIKNLVRPKGLANLGQPCLLMGSGMAIPWPAIKEVKLASDNIAEDMQLGIDLAIAGYTPQFCGDVKVLSRLPQKSSAKKSQRTRWEHGHLQTMINQIPRLLKISWKTKRSDLLFLALEISVPPLSLLVILWTLVLILNLLAGIFLNIWLPAQVILILGFILTSFILSSWRKFGSQLIPFHKLLYIPFYLLWKIPLYLQFLVSPQQEWIRTDREDN
ncbi:MAG: glycosyltransferase family 2 protein [Cyanobacteria bacterium P01_F01_bin.143]